ncbi:MAG: signal peptide peptidase SppA [Planctomycetia bacterium]|nr:MAG: signal peptide peptidase SppA [Planctomycetia bacterium]
MTLPTALFRHAALAAAVFLLTAAATAAPRNVLRLHLDGAVSEAPSDDGKIMAALFGGKVQNFHGLIEKIGKAAKDPEVAGIVMIIEAPALGFAQTQELHRTLREFRKSGKPVHAYLESASNIPYLLACAADHITLADHGDVWVAGLHAEQSFYKGFFEKIGVVADMMHCGDFKTALEPFTRSAPSAENQEMTNWLLDSLYDQMVKLIAEGRGIGVADAKAAIDTAPHQAAAAARLKLVDAVDSYAGFQQMVEKHYGADVRIVKKYPVEDSFDLDLSNPFAMLQKFSELMEPKEEKSGAGVALIYVEGAIMTGRSSEGGFGGATAGSSTVRHAIESALADDKVKAVVLRVDSPGGSALASDIMWTAATRLAKAKPLIVSMGNVAASGGYYASIAADTIFAEPTTLTGSIGVVGGKLVWKDLWESHVGITTHEYDRGQRAGMMSLNRAWNDEERGAIRKMLDDVYVQFKDRVTTSRGKRIKGELEALAGGRVYTGAQALEIGLVDRLGGLRDAINLAAEKAGLKGDPIVRVLPKKPDPMETLMRLFGEEGKDEWDFIRPGSASAALPARHTARGELTQMLEGVIGARAPAALRSKLAGLRDLITLHTEGVSCVMPMYLTFR